MSHLDLGEPYVPQGMAGITTVKCECGWEIVSIMPEESDMQICLLFNHMQVVHGLVLPLFTVERL